MFRAELLKLKNSGILWLTILGSIFSNIMLAVVAGYLSGVDLELIAIDPIDTWIGWIRFHYDGVSPMLLPMFLVILCALAIAQEQRSNTWKQLYTLPVQQFKLYWAKQLMIISLFAASHLLFVLLMLLIPVFFGFEFSDRPPLSLAFSLYLVTVISSLGILGLVYLISYYSKSFVFPLAVGIIGFVFAQLLRDYQMDIWWLPFASPVASMESMIELQEIAIVPMLTSVIAFGVTTMIGMLNAHKKIVKT